MKNLHLWILVFQYKHHTMSFMGFPLQLESCFREHFLGGKSKIKRKLLRIWLKHLKSELALKCVSGVNADILAHNSLCKATMQDDVESITALKEHISVPVFTSVRVIAVLK